MFNNARRHTKLCILSLFAAWFFPQSFVIVLQHESGTQSPLRLFFVYHFDVFQLPGPVDPQHLALNMKCVNVQSSMLCFRIKENFPINYCSRCTRHL